MKAKLASWAIFILASGLLLFSERPALHHVAGFLLWAGTVGYWYELFRVVFSNRPA